MKLIERDDLVAIGVHGIAQQNYLLERCILCTYMPGSTFILSYFHTLQICSVRVLKEKGAAWVYLLYCDLPENDEKLESDTEFCFG